MFLILTILLFATKISNNRMEFGLYVCVVLGRIVIGFICFFFFFSIIGKKFAC